MIETYAEKTENMIKEEMQKKLCRTGKGGE